MVVGPLMSGVIMGRDRREPEIPQRIDEQCAIMFRHIRDIVTGADGSPDDIVKMTVWLSDPSDRSALNREWVKIFPDADNRPARHTLPLEPGSPELVQCDFTAFFAFS